MGAALMIVFGLGGLMLYALVYGSKLVPIWLSAWGIIAGLLALFGLISPLSEISMVSQLPILFQEIVLGVWLIAKGSNPAKGSQ